jgi:hypothetical protein
MLSFTEFLTEAKTPSFKTYVKETFDVMSKLPNFSVKKKVSYGHIPNKESANFSIMKMLGKYDDSNRDENKKKFREQADKMKHTILTMLYCPSGIINAKHTVDYKFKWGDEIETQTITFTDTKNGYNATVVYKLIIEQWSMFVEFDFELQGADTVAQTTFIDFPQFVPGAILHSSWGYSMTINTYYEIVKRTNKTVYAVEIGKTDKDGSGLYGYEVPNPKVKQKTVYSGRISPSGYVKLDGKHCRIWDGKPNYYNSLD